MQYSVMTTIDEKPLATIQNFIEYVDKNIKIGIILRSTEARMSRDHTIQAISKAVQTLPV